MLASGELLIEAEEYLDDGNETHVPTEKIASFYGEEFQSLGVKAVSFLPGFGPGWRGSIKHHGESGRMSNEKRLKKR